MTQLKTEMLEVIRNHATHAKILKRPQDEYHTDYGMWVICDPDLIIKLVKAIFVKAGSKVHRSDNCRNQE